MSVAEDKTDLLKQRSEKTAPPKEEKQPQNLTPFIIVFILIVVVLIFYAGASERGITKLIEKGALERKEIPNEWKFFFYHALNSFFGGIPGLVCNFVVADPFNDDFILRSSKSAAFGAGSFAHPAHYTTASST